MKKVIFMMLLCMTAMCMTSCHGVRPNADEEAVLTMKPWFFGHGGVSEDVVTTGCEWCCWTTSADYFKITPQRYDVVFDDIMSNDNTPLDYATYITLQIKKGHSPELLQNYGTDWFKMNVEAYYRNFVRDEVSKYDPFDLMSNREVCAKIDSAVMVKVQKHFAHLNDSASFPVVCKSVITGRAKPNQKQLDEMNKTAAAIQAKQTQDRTAEMQIARGKAETERAKADKAYMQEMNLTAGQFIQLKYIEMIKEKNANIDVLVSPNGADQMWNIRR